MTSQVESMNDARMPTDADLGQAIASAFAEGAVQVQTAYDELTLVVEPAHYVALATFLRDDPRCLFVNFTDLCGVDYPQREKRFDVVLHLLSPKHNRRIRVKVITDEMTPVPSLCAVFPSANWYEREAYDLYGILFSGHPDLRRILTDYGFEGHPLRKDFPMSGFVEVWWNDAEKRVVNQPVRLSQEFRDWDFLSPWEAMDIASLPGDEKATKAPVGDKA
jgi:NADH-quinone oxidoreductase subunit C